MTCLPLLWILLGATPFELPPGEAYAPWVESLANAGFATGKAGNSTRWVRVIDEGGTWRLETHDASGQILTARVPEPTTASQREDLVWLAFSLMAPGPSLGATVAPKAAETSPKTPPKPPKKPVVQPRPPPPKPVIEDPLPEGIRELAPHIAPFYGPPATVVPPPLKPYDILDEEARTPRPFLFQASALLGWPSDLESSPGAEVSAGIRLAGVGFHLGASYLSAATFQSQQDLQVTRSTLFFEASWNLFPQLEAGARAGVERFDPQWQGKPFGGGWLPMFGGILRVPLGQSPHVRLTPALALVQDLGVVQLRRDGVDLAVLPTWSLMIHLGFTGSAFQ